MQSLTSHSGPGIEAGELRSAPSGPDARGRVAGKRALALGGARSRRSRGKGHKVNTRFFEHLRGSFAVILEEKRKERFVTESTLSSAQVLK